MREANKYEWGHTHAYSILFYGMNSRRRIVGWAQVIPCFELYTYPPLLPINDKSTLLTSRNSHPPNTHTEYICSALAQLSEYMREWNQNDAECRVLPCASPLRCITAVPGISAGYRGASHRDLQLEWDILVLLPLGQVPIPSPFLLPRYRGRPSSYSYF